MASHEEELEQRFFLLVEKLNGVNLEIQVTARELREERRLRQRAWEREERNDQSEE